MAATVKRIGIIGAGRVGTALARGLAAAGHEVSLGTARPDGESARAAVAAQPAITLASRARASRDAHVVVLAVPAAAVAATAAEIGPLPGVVVVDATNAVATAPPAPFTTQGAFVASLFPDAAVVKAFNTIGAEHLEGGSFGSARPVLPIAGDDAGRSVVAALAADLGFEVADLGGSEAVAIVENFASLWIWLAFRRGWGRDFAFAVIRR
ncbi:MAG: NAD(P)-binding domain-containing protein [Acidimicrobiia bacterium]|nr:NAD(P)-binding domain-containing protein [Acidimicrobiia bacterium]